jgi:hypothetical protein
MPQEAPVVAYVILSHRSPEQVWRLVLRLLEGSTRSHVFLHHDPSGPPLGAAPAHLPRLHLVAPRALRWGDVSLVDATVDCFRSARRDIDPDWVVLLSGQDYPLQPISSIESDLAGCERDALADIWPFASAPWPRKEEVSRYLYQYRRFDAGSRLPLLAKRLIDRCYDDGEGRATTQTWRAAQRIAAREVGDQLLLGWRPRRPAFSDELPCYVGAQWLSLSRIGLEAVLQAADDVALHRYFSRTIVPDEGFFPTALGRALAPERIGPSRRFTRWRGGAHPDVLTLEDLPQLVTSGDHFARKLDQSLDAALLDALDAETG